MGQLTLPKGLYPDPPSSSHKKNKMKTASLRVKMDDKGSDVPKAGVTPAEAVILALDHVKNVGDYPLTDIVEDEAPATTQVADPTTGEPRYVVRTTLLEIKRLRALYGKKRVDAIFPGAIPALPSSFDEVQQIVTEQSPAKDGEEGSPLVLFGSQEEAVAAAAKAAERELQDN